MSDTNAPSTSNAGSPLTPVKKNPCGKFIGSRQKQMIINLYKSKIAEQPSIKVKEMVKLLSKNTGIGQKTIQTTIADYKNSKPIQSPSKQKIRLTFKEKVDDFERNAIRKKVNDFLFRRQVPTLDKILISVNSDPTLNTYKRTNLYHLLRELNFTYSKRGRNSAFIERDDIVLWRTKFIQDIRKYRQEGRTIYYLDETWANIGDCMEKNWVDNIVESRRDAFLSDLSTGAPNPTGKGKRLIIVHIGSEEGFVNGGLLVFESKKGSADYHDEMNGDSFFDWIKGVISLLKDNRVIVMDNAPYHSVRAERCPTITWKKTDIKIWLEQKGEVYEKPLNKVGLMNIVNRIKPQFNKYVIDEYVKSKNMVVLRLPPYHCELNPIELAWSSVKRYIKMNNSTFKLPDVKKLVIEGINQCGPEKWKNFVSHVINEKKRFWDIDFIVEEVMESLGNCVMTITGDTSYSDSDY
ncbi:uncharacterized protein LOC103309534 [Acyrthosiphon pisum]|uniref:Tc1-like transposase DDE domain-containing protein n=1 Tax=Acyrthosiphon pisum TaxID=7029 RepID=A0A8R2F8F1_ACYPI|nr:uncharacterized protein LOC103309534 [Acyrthosiphon pisum]|eukprot:XP_008183387.1 PREDICTED: uncharacterized protein LOC103309534 [Acyrthosiphon pisum]